MFNSLGWLRQWGSNKKIYKYIISALKTIHNNYNLIISNKSIYRVNTTNILGNKCEQVDIPITYRFFRKKLSIAIGISKRIFYGTPQIQNFLILFINLFKNILLYGCIGEIHPVWPVTNWILFYKKVNDYYKTFYKRPIWFCIHF